MPEPDSEPGMLRVRELPHWELVEAHIDLVQQLVRFKHYDRRRRMCSGLLQLEAADIHVLNRGGSLVLRDQSGREIAVRADAGR